MAASNCVLVLLLVHIWIGTLHAVPIGNREAQGWVSCIYWKAKNCPVSVVEGNCLCLTEFKEALLSKYVAVL